jgi:hypothetical protein
MMTAGWVFGGRRLGFGGFWLAFAGCRPVFCGWVQNDRVEGLYTTHYQNTVQ